MIHLCKTDSFEPYQNFRCHLFCDSCTFLWQKFWKKISEDVVRVDIYYLSFMYQGISTCYHHYHYPHYTHKDSAVTCQVVHLNQMGKSELASSPVKCSRPVSTMGLHVCIAFHCSNIIGAMEGYTCSPMVSTIVLWLSTIIHINQCHSAHSTVVWFWGRRHSVTLSIKSPYLAKDPRSCPYQWTSATKKQFHIGPLALASLVLFEFYTGIGGFANGIL